MAIELELTSFARAVERFSEGLDILREQPDNDLIRDGVIRRCKLTYELAHKTLKRYLEMAAAAPDVIDGMTFQDLIRTGSEQGLLLNGWEEWQEYRQSRTDTSHAYSEEKAPTGDRKNPCFPGRSAFPPATAPQTDGDGMSDQSIDSPRP